MTTREKIQSWLNSIERDIQLMQQYCDHKREVEDWHGVMDAAADLRELLITQRTLQTVLKVLNADV
jgi:hypothetical protein